MNFLDASEWDEFPVSTKPVPSSLADIYSSRALFDPLLCITPEKRVPTLVKLNSSDDIESGSSLRQTKVHFDQNVAVHHLSPEVSTDISSIINTFEEHDVSPETLSMSCRSNEASEASPPIVRINVSSGDHLDISDEDSYQFSPRDFTPGPSYADEIGRYYTSSLTEDFTTFGLTDPELDLSITNSTDCGPISIMASDLRPESDRWLSKAAGACVSTGKKSKSLSAVTKPSAGLRQTTDSVEMPELRTGLQTSASGGATVGILARPELNSTLRLTKEMADLQAKEFDKHAILKGNLDPKLKGKIEEKACAKLNAESTLYTNLLSLEVQEEELLNRVAEAQLAKAKPESSERIKPEDMVSKPPDIMEFFTPDLQLESPSYTLFGISQHRTETRTVDLDRAFDIYRHIRVWNRQN